MRAAPADQLRLLDLQALDTAVDQLTHRRAHLPELAEIAAMEQTLDGQRDEAVRHETTMSDVSREQRKLETDVDQVRTRTARDQQRMQAGTSAKEAEGLQHEIDSLARRQSDLEDQLLEVMESAESAELALTGARAEQDATASALEAAAERRDSVFADVDENLEGRAAERTQLAGQLPADLITLYERIRKSSGTGAARLARRRCEGCHMELSGSDLGKIRAAAEDEVLRCEQCARILVRTDESGL